MIALLMVLFKVLVFASGIWLAFLGEWNAILWGVGILLFAHFALMILIAPGGLLAFPMVASAKRGNFPLFLVLLFLSTLLTLAAMAFWGAGSYLLLGSHGEGRSLLPLLLWSASVALGPWGDMAASSEEGEGGGLSLLAVYLFQAAYVVLIVVRLIQPVSFRGAVSILGSILALALVWIVLQARKAFEDLAADD